MSAPPPPTVAPTATAAAPAASQRVVAFPNLSSSSTSSSAHAITTAPHASASSAAAPTSLRPRPSLRLFPYSLASPNPWCITAEQLTSISPSAADGISPSTQTLLRAETADFISQMGQQCKITQLAIATGSVYLHVFFTRFSFARFDRFEIAATCLFLAGKVEERRTRVDQVINAYYHVRLNPPTTPVGSASSSTSSSPASSHSASSLSSAIHLLPPSPTSPEYEALRNRIYSLEFVVLDAIEFQFELTHPYTNLMVFLRETILGPKYANKPEKFIHNETSEKGGLAQIAWLFINDSLRSTLCLLYPPDVICVGVIALSLKYKEMAEPVRHGAAVTAHTKPWHEELFGVDRQIIEHISDVILTCVELRYKPDPAQAQALLADRSVPSTSGIAPAVPQLAAGSAASHTTVPTVSQPSRPLISIPLPTSVPAASSAARSRPSAGGAGGRDFGRASESHSRGPPSDGMERVVPSSMQQQHSQRPSTAQPRPASSAQQPTAGQAQKPAAPASRQPPLKKGYVWKPPAKSRRPAAAPAPDTVAVQEKPAAPTRPVSPSTPPSPFLSHMSPSSRPPSPFLQSLSPMSASKRKDASSTNSSTAASRKRPHSPAAAAAASEELALVAPSRVLARNDSNGRTEQMLADQLGQKMRVVSAADSAEREDGELANELRAEEHGEGRKEAEECKEEEEGPLRVAGEEGGVRVLLDDMHALKGGASLRGSGGHDELAMMHDLDKFRAELAEGGVDGAAMEAGEGETAEDIRAWKRARRDDRDSPASPSDHAAAAMATPWERDMDGECAESGAEHESGCDYSQPSSPSPHDEREHRLDQFAAVKLQSGYHARHEQQQRLEHDEAAVGSMDDGEATLSAYPSKARREAADEMAEHALLTT